MQTAHLGPLAGVSIDEPSLRDRASVAFPYVLTVVFLGLTLWGILHHEMWRDELQAWLVARDSSSMLEVIKNVRYERTPALWQVSLHFLTYLSTNPLVMQLFHLGLATTSVFLFALYSPFTRLQKVMFSFGYFSFYEYAVISRSYALGVMFIMLTCVLLTRAKRNYLLIALTLGLLANTSVYGLLIAPAFALYIGAELVVQYYRTRSLNNRKAVLLLSTLLLTVSLTVGVLQLLAPTDYTRPSGVPEIVQVEKDSLAGSFQPIFVSYVAVPNVFALYHWGTNILSAAPVLLARRIGVLASLILFASAIVLLLRKPTVLLLFASGTGVLLLFGALIFQGEIRHKGHLFILLIASFWLFAASKDSGIFQSKTPKLERLLSRYQAVFLTTILAAQLVGGIFAMAADLRNPFSETPQTAEFVRQRLTPATVFAGTSYLASPMTAYLDVKLYMIDRQGYGTFMIWDDKIVYLSTDEEKLQGLAKLLTGGIHEVLFVSEARLSPKFEGLEVTELAEFTRSFNLDRFYVYRVRRLGEVPPQFSQHNLRRDISPDSPSKN